MSYSYVQVNRGKGRGGDHANSMVAHLPGVRAHLAATATTMGMIASSILDSHVRSSTDERRGPSPTIRVFGADLDWYVVLDAGDLDRAVGIEYGHRKQRRYGASQGLGVLRSAMDIAEAMVS